LTHIFFNSAFTRRLIAENRYRGNRWRDGKRKKKKKKKKREKEKKKKKKGKRGEKKAKKKIGIVYIGKGYSLRFRPN